MDEPEFIPWPKIPRLRRAMVVTEKIDGTNAGIMIRALEGRKPYPCERVVGGDDEPTLFAVHAQSRKRIITPEADNHGFAAWVWEHAEQLVDGLTVGMHFGEWWGHGINRGYGLDHKRFSLFNCSRWKQEDLNAMGLASIGVHVVPTLSFCEQFDTDEVDAAIDDLRLNGSVAAPGFMNPEGVVIYHAGARHMYKCMIQGDHIPKGIAA